ncbi:MAG TPA: hypothetical protein VJ870_02360 [Amycolatopsis sp.]|nr:hypothetical protein [Amycolatopsis sp.]
MTAPTRTRRKSWDMAPRSRVDTMPREAERRQSRTGQQRTAAAERAYARRAQRADLLREQEAAAKPARKLRLSWPRSRASFVLIVMTLLAAGVITTLLLSTQAIADSYRLEQIKQENATLAEQSQRLQEDVTTADSASSLAARAKALGMVPSDEPAHLVQNADGTITVVGKPAKAVAAATPAPAPSTPTTAPTPPTAAPAPVTTPAPAPPLGATAPIEGDVAQGDEQQAPVVATGGQ